MKSPLNIPSIVQKRMELFEKEFGPAGIAVGHPEITAGPKQTQAMAAGSVDFANCVGGTSVIIAASQGLDIKIVGIYGRSPKAFTLLVNDPAVKSLADLKGKKIAGPKGTVLHQLLVAALMKEGMKYDDVQHIEMGIPHGVAALFGGSIDGALAAGPSVADALSKGARVLFTGEGLVDATTVVAVRGGAASFPPGDRPFVRQSSPRERRLHEDESRGGLPPHRRGNRALRRAGARDGASVRLSIRRSAPRTSKS